MTAEKFVNRLGKELQRRRFLKKAGAGAAGIAGALFGSTNMASADVGPQGPLCCTLCAPNTPIGQPCYGAYCTWAWTCCWGRTRYQCVEGYYRDGCPPPAGGACSREWRCSSIRAVGGC